MTYVRPSLCIYPIPIPDVIELENHKRNPYEIIPGHVTGMVVKGWKNEAIMMINVYLDCHDKFGTKNKSILYSLGIIISTAKLLYIIMGDWQLNSEEPSTVGWLNTIDGYVIATDEITCMQKNRNTDGSVIDYAVVSN